MFMDMYAFDRYMELMIGERMDSFISEFSST